MSKDEARISVTLKLFSPTKAQLWDPRPTTPKSSSNYTLTMANVFDIDEDSRKEICADRLGYTSGSASPYSDTEVQLPDDIDIETVIPDWEYYIGPHSEFELLEVIYGKVTYQHDSLSPVDHVADSTAFLIRRNWIADTFWDDMEGPEHETAELAFELFDRFGCLRPQYKEHPVKRGLGVWGNELDRGDILLIEQLTVSPTYRRRGIGSMLGRANLKLASKKSDRFFGITWPGVLEREVDPEISKANKDDQIAARGHMQDVAISFWRALGFRRIGSSRWLGYSPDEQHPSRSLAPNQDFDLPHFQRIPATPAVDDFIKSLPTIDHADCLTWLDNFLEDAPPSDTKWGVIDNDRNTLLHLVPLSSKTQSTQWLMLRNPNLLSQRNTEKNTPLEALKTSIERIRTIHEYMFVRRDVSDLFRGFDNGTISTLALLKGLVPDQMSEAELSCLKIGCTCGSCLGGFLSPRLRHMLLSTAEQTFDTIYTFGEANGETWFSIYGYLLEYVPERILQSLVAYKGLRTGFCMLWKYIADCIGENMLPTEDNIVTLIRNSNEWPPHCRNFIQKGGSISSAVTMLFKHTMELEESRYLDYGEAMAPITLPACRNDREIGFVSGMCGYETVTRIQCFSMQNKKIRYMRGPILR